jgi:1-acyl-sn-glycerol-3-phosphate acyltransferase
MMKKWSLGYEALRTYVRFAFWLTHRRILVTGRENIPIGKPIIFAANHQNALMDPLALVCTNPLQTLWLARADIFKSKAARPFLKFLKMIPIYRIRDGKENLSNNEVVFNQVTAVLEDNQSVALFPEAAHSGKRQMLPHKKAIPRIALDAEDKNNFQLGLQIVPVGIFNDHYSKFNRTLIVQYGVTIDINSYKDLFADNQQNAMLTLRDEIHDKLLPLTMQINSIPYYSDYDNLRVLLGKEYLRKFCSGNEAVIQLFRAEQELISKIEQLEAESPELFETIRESVNLYMKRLNGTGVTDEQLTNASNTTFIKQVFQFFGALLTLPVFVFGFIFNALPYFIPRVFFASKVKDPAFLSTFNFAFGIVLFPLFYLMEFGLLLLITSSWTIAAISLILMPFAGKLAYRLRIFYVDWYQSLRLKSVKRSEFIQLRSLRDKLISLVFGSLKRANQ